MRDKVSRIFASNLLTKATIASGNEWNHDVMNNVYLVTSDADLWPISRSAYEPPDRVDVLTLNVLRSNETMLLSNVGARVSTWRNLTKR